MLKTLLLATALVSSSAFAYDQADRDAPLGRLVVQQGQASLIQYAPQVVHARAPRVEYAQPADSPQPVQCEQPVVYVQPPQTASLRVRN